MAQETATTNNTTKPILIVGAGLAGLAVARLLTNSGIPNIVFEASQQNRSQGFSISLRDWGYSALLRALGDVSFRSLTRGVAPDRHIGGSGYVDLIMRDNATGDVLVAPDPETQPSIVRANRNALRQWIADNGDEALDVRYGHKLNNVEGKTGNVTAIFENRARYHGSLIIAADGVHSTVRSLILPEIIPEVIPAVVYHGEFRVSREEYDYLVRPLSGRSNILAGVGDGFNTPITVCNLTKKEAHLDWSYSRMVRGDDDPLYSRESPLRDNTREIPQSLLNELASRNLAQPWCHYLNAEAMQDHSVFRWTSKCVSMTRPAAEKGIAQGVVFIGDSWHAMPIFGGEGGCHALVDAVELAASLVRQDDGLESLMSSYYDGAWQRCSDAVRRSKGRFSVLHRPIAEWRQLAEKKGGVRVP
ncbi:hypothetical protein ASPTUDRAFT_939265 [Aspergillus tubingensis CBS 134.48]|uniref:FAD-binding domain-containing protein n=1 Tax=Aspergillus tubingensis (strain CBS 134.48) TaxID=767770 RepID=A0A1L9MS16_ASPTC|nr:hypothetical protein ASPTUDRAFT_939265 [Aspergillus tubingensis CBS 134.48]